MGYLMYGLFAVLVVVPFWKIFEKAGFPPALSLIMLVPFANIVALYFVAFANWPDRTVRG